MWRGKASPGEKTFPNDSILTGLSTAVFTVIIPRFYRSAGGVSTKPPRFLASMLTPPICGSITALSWHYLVSNPIRQQKLKCASCACIRGALIVVLNGCLVPSFILLWRCCTLRGSQVYNSQSWLLSLISVMRLTMDDLSCT